MLEFLLANDSVAVRNILALVYVNVIAYARPGSKIVGFRRNCRGETTSRGSPIHGSVLCIRKLVYGVYHFPAFIFSSIVISGEPILDRSGRSNNVSGQKKMYKTKWAKLMIARK